MDSVQSILNMILFPDNFNPPNLAYTTGAKMVHDAFWEDCFNRNLRLEDVEIEIRLGKAPSNGRGSFNTNIPERMFKVMMESLQSYTKWDATSHKREMVSYFPGTDSSIRCIEGEDGKTIISKQKVLHADFVGKDLPLDFRISVNLELKIDSFNENTSNRTVIRDRASFCLGNLRYDMSRLTHEDGTKEHQAEIEIIDPPSIQLTCQNAQSLAIEFENRIKDLLNSCEPIRSFHVELLRKRYF